MAVSLATLKEFLEAELACLALGGTPKPEKGWNLGDIFWEADFDKHLPDGSTLRFPFALIPLWYRHLWSDPTQLDGRVTVVTFEGDRLRVAAPAPRIPEGTEYSIRMTDFLRAVIDGQISEER